MSSTQRLIEAMADVTVLLLTRAMNEGIDEKIDIRIYKKPQGMSGQGYAVAEYRDGRDAKEKGKLADAKNQSDDFKVIFSNELTQKSIAEQTPEGYKPLDCADNWKNFFEVV